MSITPLDHDDVTDVVRAHIALQHVSYAHVADGGHATALWSSFNDRVEALHASIDAVAGARASGQEPDAIHLVARSERGAVIGIAFAFRGVGDWERGLFGEAWQPSGADWCLDTLYVMPTLRGQGLGQRLLDAALPGGRPAYLWVIEANTDAVRFYARHGFTADGFGGRSGPDWGDMDMRRLVRR